MPDKERPIAFVAMKFATDHWRDKRYLAISSELEAAGYGCVRADAIRTSGAVVDEACTYLRDADLVVIDSTGDSHSVSYEIGYCHGIDRPHDRTLLVREDSQLPFNYRHFRNRIYHDLRHLRRLIRDFLDISEPIPEGRHGYTCTFRFEPNFNGYIQLGASCIFAALRSLKFSGRCELFAGDRFFIPGHYFSIGVLVRPPAPQARPDYEWWKKFATLVSKEAATTKGAIAFDDEMSELAEKRAMAVELVGAGSAEMRNGSLERKLGPDVESLFDPHLSPSG